MVFGKLKNPKVRAILPNFLNAGNGKWPEPVFVNVKEPRN
jgi:hypothetical protein